MSSNRINKIFVRATRKALVGWETDLDSTEIINELWAWYLESPYVKRKFEELSEAELVKFSRRQVINTLSAQAKSKDLFEGRGIYSSDSVREALSGGSSNNYLNSILPNAMSALDKQNHGYAEAIRVRYDDGAIPEKAGGEAMKLARAVKSLTQHVNIIALTAGVGEGPKLRKPIDPEFRRSNGGHSDPTAAIALMLMDNQEEREEFYRVEPITEFLKGPGR